ncbi:PREDICTED: gustatory receptor for bitter taste 66a-like [Trachymyrmex cornetzi]|uniref:gustatory receptor for bitter taste 66a-like n=1 Tax=Trachymyrmex cornetzi TaxID=471704 RepID=UPI00084F1497|nr:PREDICTED: gustatory receptor for bitter taste 66a-like [Trachymyrmex cornetzi]
MAKCQERKHLLQIIKQVHLELCKITKMVCTILGVQIAWEIGEIIVILTGSLYYFYIRYITQQYKALLEQTILILAFSFMSILKTIYLGCVCKNATNEANKTIEIIHAIYGCDADTDMQEEIQQFSIQILQSQVTFFVYGITLDNRILSSILKSVSTYVVIMIQMSHSLELNDNVQLDE